MNWRRTLAVGLVVALVVLSLFASTGCGTKTSTTKTSATKTSTTPTSESPASLPTYGDVIDAYPSGARIVAIKAEISDYHVFDDGSSDVDFVGEYKGVSLEGAFYLTQDYGYDGSGPPLWQHYGDTHFYQPKKGTAHEWDKFTASCRALAKKDTAFADLYHSTYHTFLGPQFTSNITANIGELEVNPGDKLTFGNDARLVKVFAWSSASPTTSASPTSGTTASLHLPQDQAASVGGTWKISIGDSFYTTYKEKHAAAVLVQMTNISSASQNEDPSSWRLTDSSGKTYELETLPAGSGSLTAGSLGSGEAVSGYLTFVIPRSGHYTLVFTNGSSNASWDIRVS